MDYFHWTQPLLDIIPEESTKGKLLRESIASYDQENKTYTARKEFQKELERKKQTCPTLALQLLMKLQIAVDNLEDGHLNIESEDLDQVKNLIFNVDEENNLMNVITDLIGLVNESLKIQKEVCHFDTLYMKIVSLQSLLKAGILFDK